MLTFQELHSSTRKELLLELVTARKDLLQVRLGLRTKHQKDTSLSKKQKAYVAQILTVLSQMNLEDKVKQAKEI